MSRRSGSNRQTNSERERGKYIIKHKNKQVTATKPNVVAEKEWEKLHHPDGVCPISLRERTEENRHSVLKARLKGISMGFPCKHLRGIRDRRHG